MTAVVISSDYLGPMKDFGNNLSMNIQYYGNFESLFEVFHLNQASDVMGYIIVQDRIKKSFLTKFLRLCSLQISELYTPRILLCCQDFESIRDVVKKPEFKKLDIGWLGFELFSLEDIRRLYGTIFLENHDVFKGKKILYEGVGNYPLPSLDARYILQGNLSKIFSPIEKATSLSDLLEVDNSYKVLRKINPVLGYLRSLLLHRHFNTEFPFDAELDKSLSELEENLRMEYELIRNFIKEDFDVRIYRDVRERVYTISPE